MAPNLDILTPPPPPPSSSTSRRQPSTDSLQRTISDISYELSKAELSDCLSNSNTNGQLEAIPEAAVVEEAKCECCGMCEECTPEYVSAVRKKFSGKMVCGLCAEAVKGEAEKNGGRIEKAVEDHVRACQRFNRIGRAYPLLYQADAFREMLKKRSKYCNGDGGGGGFSRAKSLKNPRDRMVMMGGGGGIARSSSCIPTIGEEV